MKRTVVIAFLAFLTMAAFGQQGNGADMSVDSITIHPDIMTFFQGEMTSLMRFQAEKERVVPFFVGVTFHYAITEQLGEKRTHSNVVGGGDYHNIIMNSMAGFQIRLGQHLYLPVYGVFTGTDVTGPGDAGVLIKTDTGILLNEAIYEDNFVGALAGSGLYFTAGPFTGGLFAAYHYKTLSPKIHGVYGTNNQSYEQKDEDTQHTFKLAFLPMVDTSKFRYVGLILDNVLGYLGMGDDKNQNIDNIVSVLNWALDLGFNRFELGNGRGALRAFYYRDNYDIAARNDVYGGEIKALFPLSLMRSLGGAAEIGYRHFNSVSPYFVSKYEDGLFYKFSLFISRKDLSVVTSLEYDNVRY